MLGTPITVPMERVRREIARLALLVALGSIGPAAFGAEAGETFQFSEIPGPFAVGLKVVEQFDRSRAYGYGTDSFGKKSGDESARPMQTLIWYPATTGAESPMTVRDYTMLAMTDEGFKRSNFTTTAEEWISALGKSLEGRLWAHRDAAELPGKFPVIIYTPSLSDFPMAWENADLCESLASHGYIVIASPNLGARSRRMTPDLEGVDAQARDISFLVGYARNLADADDAHVAVVGFSWGGIAELFAAARDRRIGALVALDGSLRYFPGLVKQAGDVHPESLSVPMLFFEQANFSLEDFDRLIPPAGKAGPSVLNAWTDGDLILVRMLGLTHQEFSSMYQRNETTWRKFEDPASPLHEIADYGREDGATAYAWVARYTSMFLDAQLKGDPAALRFLKNDPAANGVPKHFMSVTYRPATHAVPSFDDYRAEVGRHGFPKAAQIYAAMKERNAGFDLEESALTGWAGALFDDRHFAEAIALLKLDVQIHPDSNDGLTSLGDAYRLSGQKQLALNSYKSALEKDPQNVDAKNGLQRLAGAR
jgi:Alpha/beta hydrolase family